MPAPKRPNNGPAIAAMHHAGDLTAARRLAANGWDVTRDLPDLPAGVHARILAGRHVNTAEPITVVVLWADHATWACPRCREPLGTPECPVGIREDGWERGSDADAVTPADSTHLCGERVSVAWRTLAGDTRLSAIAREAAKMAAEREAERDAIRTQARRDLRAQLAEAAAALDAPLVDGETAEERDELVLRGTDTVPGVYRDETTGELAAWTHDPTSADDTNILIETAGDAPAEEG